MTYPRFDLNINLDESFKFDQDSAKAAFLFALNSQPIIHNYATLVFKPLEADNVYEFELKVKPHTIGMLCGMHFNHSNSLNCSFPF